MLYTIVFITNQQLRDIKLERILNPDFLMDKYVHDGPFDYSLRVRQRAYHEAWSYKIYNDKAILNSTKWKTIRGAETALSKVKNILSEKKRISVKGNDLWMKNEYIPVICNITNEWNSKIESQIKQEEILYQKRILSLKKKLST